MKNRRHTIAVLSILGLALMGTAAHAATVGSRFDPNDFASNGVLTLTDGDSITFDTTLMTYSGTVGGVDFSGSGVAANSQSQLAGVGGNTSAVDGVFVQLAMYNFTSVNISSGVSVLVDGNAGFALGSLGDLYLGSDVRVNGTNGEAATSDAAARQGGSGGESGVAGTSFASGPPSNLNGDGGRHGGGNDLAIDGRGFGGGYNPNPVTANNNGGGAGYGGTGGGDSLISGGNGSGGMSYGDEQLTLLFGGSGGAGSNGNTNANDSSGGGGGGAMEFTAVGTLTLDSIILAANGGRGNMTAAVGLDKGSGSGSGGGILLNADDIVLIGASVRANGGGGRTGSAPAPGGGGGRIALYAENSLIVDGNDIADGTDITDVLLNSSFEVEAGAEGVVAATDGTLYISVVPEPATMSLLALGGIAMLKRRRK